MRVVAFNGSPRKNGNTAQLLRTVFAELEKEGIETELVQVGGRPIRGCIACMKCFDSAEPVCAQTGDMVNDCIAKMLDADGIILASPTYFADMTAELKALVDRAGLVVKAGGDLLQRKVGTAVVAVRRGGAVCVFDSINHFFTIGQMIVVGSSYWNLGVGLAPGDVASDEEGIQTMQNLGRNMAWALRKLKA